ncbi:hypothetical protein JM18_002902 [Phytophthora kernoviae]|uniref:RING-type domain-containing protein n=2 Tax=Phytophthora kernoviae TaxID=325452 RepID=A0A921VBX4_9STRA|nr:hypothetical protein G195_007091 [Phytophthora kernoviae 00238/432]KAG2529145.1 hypothetical protein JM18_002902 [Phytophthora kernoviae]
MAGRQQQRVLADGWGQQTTGSVFCADSSLRYIYESNGGRPGAPTSLVSLSAVDQQAIYHKNQQLQQQQQQQYNSMGGMETGGMTFAGKRPRELSGDAVKENGVDLFEAEIARACTAIRKQSAGMPHSFRECSVCLSANAYAQISSCGHTFHPACFLRWFRLNRSCPLCRGVVDKVQLAQTIVVQDELEAIMAELDDEPLQLMPTEQNVPQMPRSEADVAALDDPLLANSEQLMSFLESDFDTDMELAALDDLSNDTGTFELMANPTVMREANGDETMGMELDDIRDQVKSEVMPTYTPNNFVAPAPAPAPQQFAPASAMPNYWNVLNQGMAPPVMPPAPAVPPVVAAHQRMVHIAPKPDARTMQHQRVPAPTAVRASEPNFKPTAFQEGGMCGVSCRCTSCKNPFLMVKAAGADIDALLKDDCFMHNVSKTRDMVQRLQEPVAVPCCDSTIKVIDCVQGYKCTQCRRQYDFSWCMNKLLDSERTPRNHCAICKRCCDHRDVHCNDCGRCYFAGVAASLPCPCKEASHHKKRREAAAKNKAEEAEEEAEGECCIM